MTSGKRRTKLANTAGPAEAAEGGGQLRAMFLVYVTLIVAGLAYFIVIGLTHH
jgi:hypothetical protein